MVSVLPERWRGPEGTGSQDTGDCLLQAQPSPSLGGSSAERSPPVILLDRKRHRGSRAVEQAAPDADPTRGCRDKWKLGQRAKVLRCPGRARLREGWCWGGWCWVVGGRVRCPQVAVPTLEPRAPPVRAVLRLKPRRPDPQGGALGVGAAFCLGARGKPAKVPQC